MLTDPLDPDALDLLEELPGLYPLWVRAGAPQHVTPELRRAMHDEGVSVDDYAAAQATFIAGFERSARALADRLLDDAATCVARGLETTALAPAPDRPPTRHPVVDAVRLWERRSESLFEPEAHAMAIRLGRARSPSAAEIDAARARLHEQPEAVWASGVLLSLTCARLGIPATSVLDAIVVGCARAPAADAVLDHALSVVPASCTSARSVAALVRSIGVSRCAPYGVLLDPHLLAREDLEPDEPAASVARVALCEDLERELHWISRAVNDGLGPSVLVAHLELAARLVGEVAAGLREPFVRALATPTPGTDAHVAKWFEMSRSWEEPVRAAVAEGWERYELHGETEDVLLSTIIASLGGLR